MTGFQSLAIPGIAGGCTRRPNDASVGDALPLTATEVPIRVPPDEMASRQNERTERWR